MESLKIEPAKISQIRPISDWVLIEVDPAPEASAGGVHFVPSTCTVMDAAFGKVLACGPGWTRDDGRFFAMDVRPGQRVSFLRKIHTGMQGPFNVFGDPKDYWLIRRRCAEFLAAFHEEV